MPYRVSGSNVLHFKGGKWSIKQRCSSVANARAAMRLLEGIEHGSIKKKDIGKQSSKKNFRYEAMKKEMLKRG